ncbi:MAG: asparagine--tRNA ligase [Gemmatimonadota bacterium]|jgi:asparaginyl-tRNA synthetase|nr:asparagine--tRNA ligase [Gemmatimonadota bacterium]
MKPTDVEDLRNHSEETVTLRGWVDNVRSSGKILFLILRDGTGRVQCVLAKKEVGEELFDRARGLPQESAVTVTGTVSLDDRAPGGAELHASGVEVLAEAEPFPITPKEHGAAYLLDHRHLWLRSARQHAILRVRAEVIRSLQEFFDTRGFLRVDSPILTSNACEGTSTLFSTDYFGQEAYLSQSGQLYAEASALAFGKVYCYGPTFRAEKSKTRRHLTEFWMVEPEVAHLTLPGLLELAEEFVSHIVQSVLKNRRLELESLGRDLSRLEKIVPPFPRLRYAEAIAIAREGGSEVTDGEDLGAPDETRIAERYDKPVMVTHYPQQVKAFYMARDPEEPDRALCVDMLAPEGYGEIIGGSEREADLDRLLERMRHEEIPEETLSWYTDLRRYGTVPHAGFGLGVERVVAWLCGITHVRETIPFPRLIHRLNP